MKTNSINDRACGILRKRFVYGGFLRIAMLVLMLLGMAEAAVFAADAVTIKSCAISSSDHGKVEVSAVQSGYVSNTDGQYYLFAMLPYEQSVTKDSIMVASVAQRSVMSFSAKLNFTSANSVLFRKFAVAVKQNNKYVVVSNYMYVTNPQVLAKYNYAFPQPASKKGLHIKPTMISDAEDLGIKHAAVNICLDLFIATGSAQNSKTSYPYNYQGKTYWFRKSACSEIDSQTRELARSNVVVSGILLLRNTSNGKLLVPPAARNGNNAYYGFNVMDKTGVDTLAALMSFLGERYMNTSKSNGRIVNWIVGNEVDDYWTYNYVGNTSFSDYVEQYCNSFRVISTALHAVYGKARVYISLDHLWTIPQYHGKSYFAKSMLDAFAAYLVKTGDIPWNLAFHPYPAPLTDPVFWDDNVSNSDTTKTVTMKNIGYLSNYVKKHFRSDVRIILSEQGFTSKKAGVSNEPLQAAAYAYAYYLTEADDKIDSFIMNRHVDHVEETRQGLYLGMYTNTSGAIESANQKKQIWDVFKYIDSPSSKSVTQFALKYIHASSWESLIPGMNWGKFSRMGSYSNGKISTVKKVRQTVSIENALKHSYNGSASKKGGTTTVKVSTGSNKNLYQGAGWQFSRPLNFSTKKYFTCKIKIKGMKESYGNVRIRFFSGSHVYENAIKIKGNTTKTVAVNVSGWPYSKSVDKVQIWVRPYNRKGWKKGSKITISAMKQAGAVK